MRRADLTGVLDPAFPWAAHGTTNTRKLSIELTPDQDRHAGEIGPQHGGDHGTNRPPDHDYPVVLRGDAAGHPTPKAQVEPKPRCGDHHRTTPSAAPGTQSFQECSRLGLNRCRQVRKPTRISSSAG
jgi:hypothetical protein